MDTRLDSVAKAIAQGTTRRQALRRLGGLAGGMLAGLGLSGTAVRAQAAAECPTCRQCISQFLGGCISTCVGVFTPETCPEACCDGALTVCEFLGECTETCTATCPSA